MWYVNSNSDSIKPEVLDIISSKKWNYIRKNFELIESTEDVSEHWQWLETKIDKDDWELYEEILGHNEALDDVYAALTELAEIIAGE